MAVLYKKGDLEIGLGSSDMADPLCVLIRKATVHHDGRVDTREQCGIEILELEIGIGHQWNAVRRKNIFRGIISTHALSSLTSSLDPSPGVPQ